MRSLLSRDPGVHPETLRVWVRQDEDVRMVFEHTEEHGTQWAAIRSILGKLGMSAETLRFPCTF